jgi:biopolymer transport protein ExbB
MNLSLSAMWASMGLLSKIIALFLMGMGAASLGVVIERAIFLALASAQSRLFAPEASRLLTEGKLDEIAELSLRYPRSQLASLLRAGARRFVAFEIQQIDGERGLPPVEAARREMARRSEQLSAELRSGMGVLASVGSISPFVGLFGTVIGIITAFEGIAKTGSGGLGAVSAGIAEALIETAFGLLVAIPAVLSFNYLSSRIDAVEMAIGSAASEFIDGLEHLHGHGR